jgi:hypothetical protein
LGIQSHLSDHDTGKILCQGIFDFLFYSCYPLEIDIVDSIDMGWVISQSAVASRQLKEGIEQYESHSGLNPESPKICRGVITAPLHCNTSFAQYSLLSHQNHFSGRAVAVRF